MFGKPNYIPEEFLTATNQGWIDNRTGEILVSVKNLDQKIKQAMDKLNEDVVDDVVKQPTPLPTIPLQALYNTPDYEKRGEPKAGSNDALLDLFSQPNTLTLTMNNDFEIDQPITPIPDVPEIVVLAEQLANQIIDDHQTEHTVKRGRGRPKKEPQPEQENVVKRGRGRPKKVQE